MSILYYTVVYALDLDKQEHKDILTQTKSHFVDGLATGIGKGDYITMVDKIRELTSQDVCIDSCEISQIIGD